jgi:cytochrome c-type biogenesis protein CcmE
MRQGGGAVSISYNGLLAGIFKQDGMPVIEGQIASIYGTIASGAFMASYDGNYTWNAGPSSHSMASFDSSRCFNRTSNQVEVASTSMAALIAY